MPGTMEPSTWPQIPSTSLSPMISGDAMTISQAEVPSIMMKHTLFKGPLGWFPRLIGALPIDRTQSHNIVPTLVTEVEQAESIIIAFAPEGTRRKTDHWKSGFYYVALDAKVPIVCEYVDYRRKRVGAGLILYPSGDIAADFARIRTFYEYNGWGKYPGQLSDIKLKPS